jgi:xylulokinase
VISVSLVTSGVVFVAQDQAVPDPTGATHTFCHANGKWHRMGVMLSCGGALRWYRDTFAPGTAYDDLGADAAGMAAGSDGLSFLPYLTGERCPYNDPELKGAFRGVTLAHTRAHFTRAVFEGISFGILDCLNALLPEVPPGAVLRLTGGGAKGKFWSQMIADVTGLPCVTLEADEGPAYGAALLAGVGIGVWKDVQQACDACVRVKTSIAPSGVDYTDAYNLFRSRVR